MTASAPFRIAFIGGGNMARGIVGGLLRHGADPAGITVSDPGEAAREALGRDFGVATTPDNAAAVAAAEVVVLAVKPQIMGEVARALAPALRQRRPLVISVAAGLATGDLARWLGADLSIVRAMPNRPALVGAGATGLYAGPEVAQAARARATRVFEPTGLVVWVPREGDLDLVTALSGSGPAYFFRLGQLMADAAEAQGLDAAVARQLAARTLAGAGALVAADPEPDLAHMIAGVASKGGTTEAALNRFSALGLPGIVAAAMQAAIERSRELAGQFGDRERG